jgi:hypothetical protein
MTNADLASPSWKPMWTLSVLNESCWKCWAVITQRSRRFATPTTC